MRWDSARFPSAMRTAAVAGLMGWFALWSWRGLVEQAPQLIWPALVVGILIAVTGAVARSARLPWFAVLVVQVLVAFDWLHHHTGVGGQLGGWVPSGSSAGRLVDQIGTGAAAVNKYRSPIGTGHPEALVYLLAAAILVLLAVDLIACGLRQAPWSGLPVIITLTIPITVLTGGLAWPVFLTTGLAYVMLLAVAETDRMLAWGQAVTGHRPRPGEVEKVFGRSSARGRALQIGALTTATALVLPIFIPVAHGLFDHGKGRSGTSGIVDHVNLTNPLVNLRRDLVDGGHLPLLYARTDSTDPTYLRTTVLDAFDGTDWMPSTRNLPQTNVASGTLPNPAGIDASTPGVVTTWDLRLSPNFVTTWLPTPYPTQSIYIDRGDWRYAVNTLDITDTDNIVPQGVSYHLTAFTPQIDPVALDDAQPAPDSIQGPMTKLPTGVPAEVLKIARQVTAGGTTRYAKAVLLQNWFRSTGGFTYSLAQAPGNGMAQLTRFITTDKVGYCEQFAAAMAIMARALGIPARVVVGFLAPASRNASGTYTYTSDDLHAWPEIYFTDSGWVRFEPTPSARTGTAPAWTRGITGKPSPALPTKIPNTVKPRPIQKRILPSQGAAPTTPGASHKVPILLGLLVLVLLASAVPRLLRDSQRRRRLRPHDDPRVEVNELWNELRATVIDLGVSWPQGRSVREVGQTLIRQSRAGNEDARALEDLVEVLERARYAGSFDLDEGTREVLHTTLDRWLELLGTVLAPGSSWRARWLPRSVFESRAGATADVDERSTSLTEVS